METVFLETKHSMKNTHDKLTVQTPSLLKIHVRAIQQRAIVCGNQNESFNSNSNFKTATTKLPLHNSIISELTLYTFCPEPGVTNNGIIDVASFQEKKDMLWEKTKPFWMGFKKKKKVNKTKAKISKRTKCK